MSGGSLVAGRGWYQALAVRPRSRAGRVGGQIVTRDEVLPGSLVAARAPAGRVLAARVLTAHVITLARHSPRAAAFSPSLSSPGAAVRPDEFQAPREDGLRVVVKGCNMVAVR